MTNPLTPLLPARRWQRIVLALAGLCAAVLLFAWLALPRILQAQAERFIAEQTGHRLSMARPEIRPFELRLRLSGLALTEPDGQPLLAFDELVIDLSAASLVQRALVFDEIRLAGPELTLVELPENRLNWSPLLKALQSPPPEPGSEDKPAGLPRFDIRRFELAGGRVAFADRRFSPGFSTRVEPLELFLSDVSTLPDDSGKFALQARTTLGATLALEGTLDLNPLAVAGRVDVTGLDLAQLAPYLHNTLPAPPAGVAALAARYRFGNDGQRLDLTVDEISAELTGLRLPLAREAAAVTVGKVSLAGGRFDLAAQAAEVASLDLADSVLALPGLPQAAALPAASLSGVRVKLAERQVQAARLALNNGRVQAVRRADGDIDIVAALQRLAPAPSPPSSPAAAPAAAKPADPAPAWQFRLDAFELAGFGARLRDEGVTPAAELAVQELSFTAKDISQDLARPLPVRLNLALASGGTLEVHGQVVPAAAHADLQLALKDLALMPAQPYAGQHVLVEIAGGRLSTEGRLRLDAQGPAYHGDFALRELLIRETGSTHTLLGWKSLATRELTVTPQRLAIGELRLNGLDSKLIIAKDKTINFQKVIKPPASEGGGGGAAAESAAVPPAPTFAVSIDRLRFYNGELFFADESLVLPFGTRIHGLRGSLSHLSSQSGGAHGQVELEGEVDEYGMARAVGQVNLFDPTGFMDLRVLFKNVEMTRLTPYVATFAGRKIDSGKLSLDLQYKLQQRQLAGDNQIIVDRLQLGERVDSPTAKDLPLDLAIALLEDSNGRIDLGLPVSGSLDDPQFSIGGIVWKAITNVLTKIVTAPFRALGALFGGGETLDTIAFEAGARQLTPPEREKMAKLAGALTKRPNLQLSITGTWAEEDRVALQDMQLRRSLLKASGEPVNEERDPGPVSTALPKIRAALEDLFKTRIGAADLAALKEGFRQANPGQLEESLTGKMMSRFSGLLREKKTLSADEVAGLKGGDFYAIVYERLRGGEAVPAARLTALAEARAAQAALVVRNAGIAAERLQVRPAERLTEAQPEGVPLKLGLEPVKKD